MTVVVTGASGHVGANLVRALLADGRQVRGLIHRDRRGLDGLALEQVQGDICDLASVDRAFEDAEIFYHAAAEISLLWDEWERLHAVNVLGTRNVAQACLRNQVQRLIHFSSADALDLSPSAGPIDEGSSLVDPTDARRAPAYDRSKAAAEMEVRNGIGRGLDAVIRSPAAIIGPHDYKPSHQGEMLVALAGRRLPALVAGGYSWVDVRDVVSGAIRANRTAPPATKYILAGHWASLRDLAGLVQETTGIPAAGLVCPTGLARLAAPVSTAWARMTGSRPLFTRVSLHPLRGSRQMGCESATRDLGYHPCPLRETLEDTTSGSRRQAA